MEITTDMLRVGDIPTERLKEFEKIADKDEVKLMALCLGYLKALEDNRKVAVSNISTIF